MRPLVIGPDELADLARVRAHAEAHFFTLDALKTAAASGVSHCTDRGFRCVLPRGFRVAFTIEQHPGGWARHLSVSLADAPAGTVPGPHAMRMIGRELGMRMDILDPSSMSYSEGSPPFAISVIEPFAPAHANGPASPPGDAGPGVD